MNVLITAGATREPIDPVRYLSNGSTGTTGAALATSLAERGHEVTLLRGEGAASPSELVATKTFTTTAHLLALLQHQLSTGNFGAVIMAAAVSDYRPEESSPDKLSSDESTRTLRLVRNPKMLPRLRSFSPGPLRVVGFKLTVGANEAERLAAVRRQLAEGGVDYVVHNDLEEIRRAEAHPFRLFESADVSPVALDGVSALAEALDQRLPLAPE